MGSMEQSRQGISRCRIAFAGACFILAFTAPAFIPLVLYLPVSVGAKTVLSGLLVFGIPELLIVLTIAIAGKEGYQLLKGKVVGLFKEVSPPRVSKPRYVVGLVMFILPLAAGLLDYSSVVFEQYSRHRIVANVVCDVIFVASFFVLGGEFWDKVRSLFVYRSKAVFLKPEE